MEGERERTVTMLEWGDLIWSWKWTLVQFLTLSRGSRLWLGPWQQPFCRSGLPVPPASPSLPQDAFPPLEAQNTPGPVGVSGSLYAHESISRFTCTRHSFFSMLIHGYGFPFT